MAIQLKRGKSSARSNYSDELESGQPFFETDTKKLYIGDGTTPLKDLKAITDSLDVTDLKASRDIFLGNSNGSSINIKNNGQTLIEINTDGGLSLSGTSVTIQGSSLTLKSSEELTVDGAGILKATYSQLQGIHLKDFCTTHPICFWRGNNIVTRLYGPAEGGSENTLIYFPAKSGTIALTTDIESSIAGVTSVGGQSGIITLSSGLKMSGKQLVNKVKDIYTQDGYLCIDTNYTN